MLPSLDKKHVLPSPEVKRGGLYTAADAYHDDQLIKELSNKCKGHMDNTSEKSKSSPSTKNGFHRPLSASSPKTVLPKISGKNIEDDVQALEEAAKAIEERLLKKEKDMKTTWPAKEPLGALEPNLSPKTRSSPTLSSVDPEQQRRDSLRELRDKASAQKLIDEANRQQAAVQAEKAKREAEREHARREAFVSQVVEVKKQDRANQAANIKAQKEAEELEALRREEERQAEDDQLLEDLESRVDKQMKRRFLLLPTEEAASSLLDDLTLASVNASGSSTPVTPSNQVPADSNGNFDVAMKEHEVGNSKVYPMLPTQSALSERPTSASDEITFPTESPFYGLAILNDVKAGQPGLTAIIRAFEQTKSVENQSSVHALKLLNRLSRGKTGLKSLLTCFDQTQALGSGIPATGLSVLGDLCPGQLGLDALLMAFDPPWVQSIRGGDRAGCFELPLEGPCFGLLTLNDAKSGNSGLTALMMATESSPGIDGFLPHALATLSQMAPGKQGLSSLLTAMEACPLRAI